MTKQRGLAVSLAALLSFPSFPFRLCPLPPCLAKAQRSQRAGLLPVGLRLRCAFDDPLFETKFGG
jgi:hypothetical protein